MILFTGHELSVIETQCGKFMISRKTKLHLAISFIQLESIGLKLQNDSFDKDFE